MNEDKTLTINISRQDIPDFYAMVRWSIRTRGNTFTYLKQELDKRFPELKKAYGDDDDTEYYTVKQRRYRRAATVRGYLCKRGHEERMNLYKPKWLIKSEKEEERKCGAFERNLIKAGFTVIELKDDGESEEYQIR